MGVLVLFLGVVLALAIVVGAFRLPNKGLRGAAAMLALVVVILSMALGSIRFVGSDQVGVVTKNAMGGSLKEGKIIAVNGEMGVQADVMAPGWHFWVWPVIYAVETVPLTEVQSGQVGIIETSDGQAMGEGQLFAPEWPREQVQGMLDARTFLTTGKGLKGKQTTVLTPGKYRLNTQLFRVKMVDQTEIRQGEVGALKANFGSTPSVVVRGVASGKEAESTLGAIHLAKEGEAGVRKDVLSPGKYALNTDAFTLIEVWTTPMVAHFTAGRASNPSSKSADGTKDSQMEEKEIKVTTSDGFRFPVDVRVEYEVMAENAPLVVATLQDDEGEQFRNVLNSAVRAIFRNNAENVRALDYIQQRSIQETQSLAMLKTQMARYGVTINAVRIGDVGDETTLGELLKTQRDREIAKQEQTTFQEQQKAAEQKKQLSKSQQESEEERRLATAAYGVKIAMETQKQKVAEAEGEAQAIQIKATAQAEAYKKVADQIGKNNAALIELLKIVGDRNIQITPRVMVGGSAGRDAGGAALVGTLLDQRRTRDEVIAGPAPAPSR